MDTKSNVINKMTDLPEVFSFYKRNSEAFVKEIIGFKPTEVHQVQVLRALDAGERYISIKSGHGTGKTAIASCILQWYLTTHYDAEILCTAPTLAGLYDVLWKEAVLWFERSKVRDLFNVTSSKISFKGRDKTWFAAARTATKPENLQGRHAENFMLIVDEAGGVDPKILEVVQGALTTKGAYAIMLGNPTQISGSFYESFHSDREYWKTFTFNSEDTPLADPEYSRRMARYGKDSNVYRVRVLGEFPLQEHDTFISLDLVEAAIKREQTPSDRIINIGIDVARYGEDESSFCVRQGNKILELWGTRKESTMQTAGRALQLAKKYEQYEVVLNIDDTGVGGGVTDSLAESKEHMLTRAWVNPVNFGSTAESESFYNKGAEMWDRVRTSLETLDLPEDAVLTAQLTTRKYKITSKGKIRLEPKEEMTKRSLKSPDRADALALTYASNFTSDDFGADQGFLEL